MTMASIMLSNSKLAPSLFSFNCYNYECYEDDLML